MIDMLESNEKKKSLSKDTGNMKNDQMSFRTEKHNRIKMDNRMERT